MLLIPRPRVCCEYLFTLRRREKREEERERISLARLFAWSKRKMAFLQLAVFLQTLARSWQKRLRFPPYRFIRFETSIYVFTSLAFETAHVKIDACWWSCELPAVLPVWLIIFCSSFVQHVSAVVNKRDEKKAMRDETSREQCCDFGHVYITHTEPTRSINVTIDTRLSSGYKAREEERERGRECHSFLLALALSLTWQIRDITLVFHVD